MTEKTNKPQNTEATARERRLKQALRANLKRRREKAHTLNDSDTGDVRNESPQESDS